MPNPTVRASATALPISQMTRDPVLRAAFATIWREPPHAPALIDRKPAPRLSGGTCATVARVLEMAEA